MSELDERVKNKFPREEVEQKELRNFVQSIANMRETRGLAIWRMGIKAYAGLADVTFCDGIHSKFGL